MSSNSNTFRISNEHLLLINILNTMYNDNTRQINNINETLNNLIDTNNRITNLLTQLLYDNRSSNQNNRRNNYSERRNRENNDNRNRIYLNNRPYLIDSVTEYTIPRQNFRNNSIPTINTNSNNFDIFTQMFQNFMQPVEIYPTQSQIESATRNVRYCDISRPINTQCPISMEDFDDNNMVTVIRHCGHIFNTENLMNWFRTNCRCPVCRYDIRDYNSNASNEFFNSQNNRIQNNGTINDNINNNSLRDNNHVPNPNLNTNFNGDTNVNTNNTVTNNTSIDRDLNNSTEYPNLDLSNNTINDILNQEINNLFRFDAPAGNSLSNDLLRNSNQELNIYLQNLQSNLSEDLSGNLINDYSLGGAGLGLYIINALTRRLRNNR